MLIIQHSFFRQFLYEFFLRLHQALAALLAYSIWCHLPTDKLFPVFYLYLSAALFAMSFVLQAGSILYRNNLLRLDPAQVSITYDSADRATVKARIKLSRPLDVQPGQYINVWIPSISAWSFLQSHPFTVTSWAEGGQDTLEVYIKSRRGFTRDLFCAAAEGSAARSRLLLFIGPHGISAPVGDYDNVLMIADGAGIAAQVPYLKKLIYGYNVRRVYTRRIHLIWQLEEIAVGLAAQSLLNSALDEDKLDQTYVKYLHYIGKSKLTMILDTTCLYVHQRTYQRRA